MLDILNVVLPVFVIIAAGYAAVKAGVFPDAGVDALLQFVVRIAVPALLFSAMYRLSLDSAFEPRMIVSFYIGAFAAFGLGLAAALQAGLRPGDAVAIGFAAYFSNTVLVGLPVMIRAYGEPATEPMFAILAFHAPLLYAFGLITMEMMHQQGRGAAEALRRAGRSIVSNALMIGIALGLALNLSGVPLPAPVVEAIRLLGQASLPTALFGIGAALTRYKLQREIGWAAYIAGLSLLVHPGIAYVLTAHVFVLEPEFTRAAVVTAAMPAGMNVYVFAVMYHRAEGIAASTVLLSTALSCLTISVWLAVLGGAGVDIG